MTTLKHNILTSLIFLLSGLAITACSSEQLQEPSPGLTGVMPTIGISIGVSGPTRSSDPGDFEPGVGVENYLDIARDNYRIYFFDANNKYIATFKPIYKPSFSSIEKYPDSNGVDTYFYNFWGEAPKELPAHFKLVILSNWGIDNYPLESETDINGKSVLKAGVTTIEDITTHVSAQFDHLVCPENGEWLSIDEDRLIPFYGVRDYDLNNISGMSDYLDGDKIKPGSNIELRTNNLALPLLRAMAKVEVILDNPFASFSAVEMTRVNAKGFCAPYKDIKINQQWNFDYTDYFHNYTWETDFVRGVHLVNNGDNQPATENEGKLAFKKVSSRTINSDNTVTPEKWVAYVPEYRNIGVGNGYTSIIVTLANPDPEISGWKDPSNNIYFAKDGSAVNNADNPITSTKRYNIERNNIYRFTVKGMSSKVECVLDVTPYTSVTLKPEFGLDRDENGNIIYPTSKQ